MCGNICDSMTNSQVSRQASNMHAPQIDLLSSTLFQFALACNVAWEEAVFA